MIGDSGSGNANVISGNLGHGIHLTGLGSTNSNTGTTHNTISNNFIGTDITGANALGNGLDGVLIDGGANVNTIGSHDAANVISGNKGDGIHITGSGVQAAGSGSGSNIIIGNYIGVDAAGTKALPNTGTGIHLDNGTNSNSIGDGTPAGTNIIAGNGGDGILMDGSNLVVTSGKLGTRRTASSATISALEPMAVAPPSLLAMAGMASLSTTARAPTPSAPRPALI